MTPECPRCGNNHTHRHDFRTYRKISLAGVESRGYQRWFCVACNKPFIPVELKRAEASTDKRPCLFRLHRAAYLLSR